MGRVVRTCFRGVGKRGGHSFGTFHHKSEYLSLYDPKVHKSHRESFLKYIQQRDINATSPHKTAPPQTPSRLLPDTATPGDSIQSAESRAAPRRSG